MRSTTKEKASVYVSGACPNSQRFPAGSTEASPWVRAALTDGSVLRARRTAARPTANDGTSKRATPVVPGETRGHEIGNEETTGSVLNKSPQRNPRPGNTPPAGALQRDVPATVGVLHLFPPQYSPGEQQ